MKNLYVEELKFIANLALEFRLSLKNICKYFNVDASENNQLLFYNEIIRCLKDNVIIEEFKYLVYETTNESEEVAKRAYNISRMFYLKFLTINNKYLKSESKSEAVKKCLSDLKSTDVKVKKVIDEVKSNGMNEERITIISKFRIKHVITKEKFSEVYGINRNLLSKWEKSISDPILKKRVDTLNDYHYNTFIYKLKKRAKK